MEEFSNAGVPISGIVSTENKKHDGLFITGFVVGSIPVLFFGIFGLVAHLVLDPFGYWLYADLTRYCGDWCIQVTFAGWIVLALYFVGIALGVAYFLKKIYLKKGRWLVLFHFLVVALFVLLAGGLTFLNNTFGRNMPRTPVAFRCLSVFTDRGESYDLEDRFFGGRANCLNELAVKRKDVSWCDRLRDDPISQSRCRGAVARETGDISLCESLEDMYKSFCVDVTLNQTSQEEFPTSDTQTTIDYQAAPLEGMVGGNVGRTNFFPLGDIMVEPTIAWTRDGIMGAVSDPLDPIPVGNTVLVSAYSVLGKNKENTVLYDDAHGSPVWTLYPKDYEGYYGGPKQTPTIVANLLFFTDYNYLYAYSIESGKLLWKIGPTESSPVSDGNTVYFIKDTEGGFGYNFSVGAVDAMTGTVRWVTPYVENAYTSGFIVLSETRIFVADRTVGYDNNAYLHAFDKQTGAIQYRIEHPLQKRRGNEVMGLVYADGKIFLRTGDGIAIFDEKTGSVVTEYVDTKVPDVDYDTGTPHKSLGMAYNAGNIYYSDGDRSIVRRNVATGEIVWTEVFDGPVDVSPILTPQFVYTATKSDIYALKRDTGEIVWKFKIVDTVGSNLTAGNGSIFFTSTARRLNVLR